jgi:hypothetical protein
VAIDSPTDDLLTNVAVVVAVAVIDDEDDEIDVTLRVVGCCHTERFTGAIGVVVLLLLAAAMGSVLLLIDWERNDGKDGNDDNTIDVGVAAAVETVADLEMV